MAVAYVSWRFRALAPELSSCRGFPQSILEPRPPEHHSAFMRLRRGIASIAPALLVCASMMLWKAPVSVAAPCGDGSLSFSGGSGTSASPFLISTEVDLVSLRDGYTTTPSYYSCSYRQTADITMSAAWQHGIGFSTPGSALYKPFEGAYDGNGHAITNLTINAQSVANANQARELGFIGLSTSGSASIANLDLVNVSITCGYEAVYAGMLVAETSGSVSRSSASGSVTCSGANAIARMGGLIGYTNGVVANAWVSGTITAPTTPPANFSPNSVGGVVGRSDTSAEIRNVVGRVAIVNFSSAIYAGVFTGYNSGSFTSVYAQSGLTAGLTGLTGAGSSVGASSKSASELRDIATYVGWSISQGVTTSTVWGIDPSVNSGFPFLQQLPSESDGGMPPILQALPLASDGTCANPDDGHVAYGSGVSGGWGTSWAEWANAGTGGPVCVRTLIYAGSRWVVAH